MNLRERIISFVPPAVAKRIHETPFGKRLAKGAFWTLIGSVAIDGVGHVDGRHRLPGG